MRNTIRGAVIAAAIAGACTVTSSTALADSQRILVDNQPFDVPAVVCGFPVHVGIVTNNQYYLPSESNPDGSETQRVTGNLVASLTNETTGKTIVVNLSGPGQATFYPNGGGSFGSEGPSFGVADAALQATGIPGIWLSNGAVTGTFDTAFETATLSVSGRLTDACALLA